VLPGASVVKEGLGHHEKRKHDKIAHGKAYYLTGRKDA